jgi:L-2-hydroxyglutarate oxidase LhgO
MVTHMERIDVAVIGGGVTGLASARAIAALSFSTCVLNATRVLASTRARAMRVIHAASITRPGRKLGCASRPPCSVRPCSTASSREDRKIIVANDGDELSSVEALHAQGVGNGVGP